MGQNANTSNLHRAVKNIHRNNPKQKKTRSQRSGDSSSGNTIYTAPVRLGGNMMEPQLEQQSRIISIKGVEKTEFKPYDNKKFDIGSSHSSGGRDRANSMNVSQGDADPLDLEFIEEEDEG